MDFLAEDSGETRRRDFFLTTRHSMSTDFEIIPVGFAKGPAVLRVRLLRLRADELAMRGGRNRFKIVSVSSC